MVLLLFFLFWFDRVFLVFGWWVFCLCLGVVALGIPPSIEAALAL